MTDVRDELRELGRGIAVTARDDLSDLVLARISAPGRRTHKWRRWLAALGALLAAVGVSAAVSAPVRATIAQVFRFGGTEVHSGVGPTPVASPSLPGASRTDLAAAGRDVGFVVRTPAALGPPDSVTVVGHRVVELRFSRPSGPVQLDEFVSDSDIMFDKYTMSGLAQRVDLNGRDAFWFELPTTLVYVLPDGVAAPESARLTNGTLLWMVDGVTYRLDGVRPLAAALAVASSIR
ncbi:MAG TPA: hypothetical protein VFR11_02870 [Micromonosporaceae bacterium]|jgi:hypothetical protein|nr:hypothetical protein [Micromonosporaceae bacterium]